MKPIHKPPKKKHKLPSNITVSIAFLEPVEEELQELLALIVKDYCRRFKAKITKNKVHISIAGIENSRAGPGTPIGMTIANYDNAGKEVNRILVQIRDPYLDDDVSSKHIYILFCFLQVICHEFVHVAQHLTGRLNGKTNNFDFIKYTKKRRDERYFFDPDEIEARLLETFYAYRYAFDLLVISEDILPEALLE